MRKIRVAINGLGRIGRAFLKAVASRPELEIVAVNDLADKANMSYLLTHDSVYGRSDCTLEGIKYLSEKEPSKLPWKELDIDVVVESTGFFASAEKSQAHLHAG